MRSFALSVCVAMAGLLSGCSFMSGPTTEPIDVAACIQEIQFSPYPFTLKRVIDVERELKIEYRGGVFSGQAALHADHQTVNLTVSQNGQSVWSIRYNGETIHEERTSEVPANLQAKTLLRDLGLAYWPGQAIQAQLKGHDLHADALLRRITDPSGNIVLTLSYRTDTAKNPDASFILENPSAGYRLSF